MVSYILNLLNHTLSDYNWNGPRDFNFVSSTNVWFRQNTDSTLDTNSNN